MKSSDSINELAAALSKAQGGMAGAKKDSANPFFKSSYADLASVVEAIKKPFADNGLSYVQGVGHDETEAVLVTTRLMHSSGQWIEDTLRMKPAKNDPQGVGSTITYARRYALQSMAGVPSEDDDGNAGTHTDTKNGRAPAARTAAKDARESAPPPIVSDERQDALMRLRSALADLYKKHPDVLPLPPSMDNDKAKAARLAVVSQVVGRELVSINGLSASELDHAVSEIKARWA